MTRKTISLEFLKEFTNKLLVTDRTSKEFREGVIHVCENTLREAGAWKGFNYLGPDKVPYGELPGINYDAKNLIEYRFANTDHTRARFF
jgi:hypothetical protein